MTAEPRRWSWRGIALAIAAAGLSVAIGTWAWLSLSKSVGSGETEIRSAAEAKTSSASTPEILPAPPRTAGAEPRGSRDDTEGDRPIVVDSWPSTSTEAPNLEIQKGEPSWETEMKVILRSRIAPAAQAQKLLAMLQRTPPEAYGTLVDEAMKRLPDSEYDSVALPLILDARTNGAALIPLHADLLGRPDPIALPVLLKMAQTPDHPLAASAAETLGLLVGGDYGKDWAQWQAAVAKALQASSPR